jgi:CelD/BcsL family acetyltransferase involved in cellulose biosynthesis
VKAAVCRPHELGAAELERWRELSQATPALRHPFLSAEYARAVSEISERTRVAVVEDDSKIVGFFPFDHGSLGVAQPVGGKLGYRQGFVHAPDLPWSWPELLQATGLHAVEFTDLAGEQGLDDDPLEVLTSPIVDTSTTWEHYLEQVRKRRRIKNTLYLARRMEREFGAVVFRCGEICTRELHQLIAWKSEQYRRSGWRDPFSRKWVRDLFELFSDRDHGRLEPVFSTLYAGDELVAVDLSLQYDDVYAGWFGAYNPASAAFSPGAIRMLRTIEHACNTGVAYIDLARGDERYKRSFRNADVVVRTGVLHDHSANALAYRAMHAPGNALRSYILSRPRVREFVRTSLRRAGAVRVGTLLTSSQADKRSSPAV